MYSISYSLDSIKDLVSGITIHHIETKRLIALKGEMGVGKTTFVKHLVEHLGFKEKIQSPTFSYYNEYLIPESNLTIRHFDLYRIESLNQFKSKGFEELIIPEENTIIIIEWPEIIESIIETIKNKVTLKFTYIDENQRTIEIIQ
jgi:tRNA threonylcarbamoyladenosine biosynthesis protein TsaE